MSIYHLNPPKLLVGLLRSGLGRYRRSFNIGYWAWELETLPTEWIEGLRFVDAVMAPSTFSRDAVARYTSKPVVVVPSHGPTGDAGFIATYRGYLIEVRDRTTTEKKAGKTAEQTSEAVTAAMADRFPDKGRLGGAIRAAETEAQ